MNKRQQQKSVYDSVFDFIFSVQQSGENKPFPKPHSSAGVYASSLIEIGTQPAIYPLESAFRTINGYVEGQTQVDLGDGVSVSMGSILRGEGNKDIKKEISKNRARANFARIGGNLHSGIDGALVSLYSKYNGASAKTAYEAGKLFADLKRKGMKQKQGEELFGYRTEKEIASEDSIFARRGTDMMVTELVKRYPELNKKMLRYAIDSGQKQGSYAFRKAELRQRLKMAGITKVEDLNNITGYIWGDGKKDLGLFLRDKGKQEALEHKIERVMGDFESRGEDQRRQDIYNDLMKKDPTQVSEIAMDTASELARKEFLDPKMMAELKKIYESEPDARKRRFAVFKLLNKNYQYDTATRGRILRGLESEFRTKSVSNTGEDIATNAVTTSLALSIAGEGANLQQVKVARSKVGDIIQQHTGKDSFGSRTQRGLLLFNWVKSSGKGDILREGNWEKFGEDDLNFTKIVEKKTVKDKNGKEIGSYYVAADSVIGRILGSAYYLHPNNLIKGLFLDGSLWLKWASGNVPPGLKRFAMFMYKSKISNVFSLLAKPMNFITKRFTKLLNPLAQSIKRFARNALKKLIGASGPAGWLVNILMDMIGDKIKEAIAQVAQAVVVAVVAMLLVLVSSGNRHRSTEANINSILSSVEQEEVSVPINTDVFTEKDFSIELEELLKDTVQDEDIETHLK
ncbi:MAG: hypothetical protein ACOX06_01405 [Candidatus Dojkabacteria bacterium]|jgi:hypothetical protein